MKKIIYLVLFSWFVSCNWKPAIAQIDTSEYPTGFVAPAGYTNVMPAIQQLQTFPVPRYRKGYALLPNYNVMDPIYFGGRIQPGVTDAQSVTNSVTIQEELAKNFNYMINVSWNNDNWNNAWVNLANANPQWKVALMTLRAQTQTKFFKQDFPMDHYFQNSQGQPINSWGGVAPSDQKLWRATAPIPDYTSDGTFVRNLLNTSLANLTRDVDLVNEDGEVYPIVENQALYLDPGVVSAKNASGLGWQQYWAHQVRLQDNAYRDLFMSHPRLTKAVYTEYRLDGHRNYQMNWDEARNINSTINGQKYPTGDFYVRYPYNWKDWVSAWHGLRWVTEGRYYELKMGDKLYSPFVAAGWDKDETKNVRPAQWLGLLKLTAIYGAEFYYTGYFNEAASYAPPNPPPNDPKGYAWQVVIPSYVQALTSYWEKELLRDGYLMPGDMIDNQNYDDIWNDPCPFYQFSAGATNKIVAVRKSNTKNLYVITGTIQNSDNIKGSTPLTSTATINLDGNNLTFNIRRQGSTYIFDNTNTSARVFYQIDGWHEASHPIRWSKDIEIEAEVADTITGQRKSYLPSFPNVTDAKTVVALSGNQYALYTITPRTTESKYLFVKAKGGSLNILFDDLSWSNTNVAQDGWYKFDLGNVTGQMNHGLMIVGSSGSNEIDSISVSNNPNKHPFISSTCSLSVIITASKSNPCPGDTVLLSVSTNNSYLWSTGETIQTIKTSREGSYSVTVSNGTCSVTSQPYTIAYSDSCPNCPAPTGLYINNVKTDAFTVHWDLVTQETKGYDIFVQDKIPGSPIVKFHKGHVADVRNRKSVAGLISKHSYDVWMTTYCTSTNISSISQKINVVTK